LYPGFEKFRYFNFNITESFFPQDELLPLSSPSLSRVPPLNTAINYFYIFEPYSAQPCASSPCLFTRLSPFLSTPFVDASLGMKILLTYFYGQVHIVL